MVLIRKLNELIYHNKLQIVSLKIIIALFGIISKSFIKSQSASYVKNINTNQSN